MTNEEIESLVEEDLAGALATRNDQVNKIAEWIKIYDGEPYGNEDDSRSSIVWKLAKKQGETLISNLSKPFIGTHKITDLIPLTSRDVHKSKIYSSVNNHFWNKDFNKNKFVKQISRLMVKEGTAFIRVGWDKVKDTRVEKLPANTPEVYLQKLQSKGASIESVEDGFKATFTKIVSNRPTAKPIRLEDAYFDPTADSFEEVQFFSYDYTTTLSDLRRQPDLYSKDAVDKLEKIIQSQDDRQTNSYESSHQYNPYSFESSIDSRKKIRINEYWGDIDIDDDGINKPCVAITAKYGDDRVLMKLTKNSLPFKEKPFICIPLVEKEFSVYGDALAPYIADEQRFMTSIIRGIIDNMSASNNGTKFVKKGALDSQNFQRMLDNERVVEINTNESISAAVADGSFNQLPGDVYNTLQMIESQSESLTGVSKMMQGIPGTEIKSSSSNFSAMMSQSQIRLLDMTTSLTSGLRRMFYMWISMASEYLSFEEIQDITGMYIPELKAKEAKKLSMEMGVDELPADVQEKAMQLIYEEVNDIYDLKTLKYDINMKVGTDGLKDIKINQLNMLMQQAGNLVSINAVPPKVISMLFADMADAMDRPDIAEEVLEYKPQPNPMEEELAKAELEGKKAEAAKDMALADNASARANKEKINTKKAIQLAGAELSSKEAQTAKTISDIDNSTAAVMADNYAKIKGASNEHKKSS